MLFSCKISSAVLKYFEQESIDSQSLLEGLPLPEEFLRDPSYWLSAPEMEEFLRKAVQLAGSENPWLLKKIGHSGVALRPWGLLDSVLRMMPRPEEILAQPGRFLSYFVSPEPPVENVVRTETSVLMDIPISSDMYPLTTEYLRAAFETLPEFVGRPRATCLWQGIQLKIEWDVNQATMFSEDPGHQLSPELLRSIVSSLEKHQKELQQKNSELQAHNEALLKAQIQLESQIKQTLETEPQPVSTLGDLAGMEPNSIELLRHQFARLSDYMVRAQQLVTIVVGANRASAAVKEAMRRVDWERVQKQFPETVSACQQVLNNALQTQNLESSSSSKKNTGELNV